MAWFRVSLTEEQQRVVNEERESHLPSCSPNRNLIERLWKHIEGRALYGRYHPKFADFQKAIEGTVDQRTTTHKASLASLMTLKFQRFKNVSRLPA